MKCPRCRTKVFETEVFEMRDELGRLELHVCLRCGGGWVDHLQLTEILNRLRQPELNGHDPKLADWVERVGRALTKELLDKQGGG